MKDMGFLQEFFENKTRTHSLKHIPGQGEWMLFQPNPDFIKFLEDREIDSLDVAYIVEKVRRHCQNKVWISLPLSQRVRVRDTARDVIARVKREYRDFPRQEIRYEEDEMEQRLVNIWLSPWIIRPQDIIQEIVQRTFRDILNYPHFDSVWDLDLKPEDIVMLQRQHFHDGNAFSSEEYLRQKKKRWKRKKL